MNIAMSCVSSTTQIQEQEVTIGGFFSVGGDVSARQTAQIDVKCLSNPTIVNQLQSEVVSAIASTTDAKGVGILSGFGQTNAEQQFNLQNIIKNVLSVENIQNMYNAIQQQQRQKVTINTVIQLFQGVSAEQTARIYAEAVTTALINSGVIARVESQLQAAASSTTESPLDFIPKTLSGVFSGITGALTGAVAPVVIVLIVALAVFLIYLSRSTAGVTLASSAGKALESRANPLTALPGAKSAGPSAAAATTVAPPKPI